MKQNLQPPATPLEMLSLFFPGQRIFLVGNLFIFLEEKPSIPQEHSHYIYIPKVSSRK